MTRLDAEEKVSVTTDFADDLHRGGCLNAKLLLSPHPHARIKRIAAAAPVLRESLDDYPSFPGILRAIREKVSSA